MPSYKQKCLARAKELGVKVAPSSEGLFFEVELIAPDGKIFAGLGLRATVTQQRPGTKRDLVWKLALADMDQGLEACRDPECDSCCPVADGDA